MFPKIGLPQNGWFIMENPLKWMIWHNPLNHRGPFSLPKFGVLKPRIEWGKVFASLERWRNMRLKLRLNMKEFGASPTLSWEKNKPKKKTNKQNKNKQTYIHVRKGKGHHIKRSSKSEIMYIHFFCPSALRRWDRKAWYLINPFDPLIYKKTSWG